jgi:hypothetical protein
MQGQMGKNAPNFFRSFTSSFAWMSGYGSSVVCISATNFVTFFGVHDIVRWLINEIVIAKDGK